jgi:hypothetical protein
LTGSFEVLEAVYTPSGEVDRFAADFEQHCEGGEPALHGAVRFNSTVPLPVLIPPSVESLDATNADGCVEATGPAGAEVNFIAASSNSIPVDYFWATTNGHSGSSDSISFPVALDESVGLDVVITDPLSGDTASKSVTTCVTDTTAPSVTILSPSDGDTFTGSNARLEVVVVDVVDDSISEYSVGLIEQATLGLDASGTGSYNVFNKAKDGPITVEIAVEAGDASGNIGSASITVYRLHDNR